MPINYLAVLVAAVVYFIIGFLFHGPLFGKTWMKLANVTPTGNEKFSDMKAQMFWNLVANIVTAYVLAVLYALNATSSLGGVGVWKGMCMGVLVWVGFIVACSSMEVIWMKKSKKLWLFEMTCTLVGFLAMGAIIAVM